MEKETLRSELIKFTNTLINGYTGESTILELLGTNDCVDDYVDNQLRERWQKANTETKQLTILMVINSEVCVKCKTPLKIDTENGYLFCPNIKCDILYTD